MVRTIHQLERSGYPVFRITQCTLLSPLSSNKGASRASKRTHQAARRPGTGQDRPNQDEIALCKKTAPPGRGSGRHRLQRFVSAPFVGIATGVSLLFAKLSQGAGATATAPAPVSRAAATGQGAAARIPLTPCRSCTPGTGSGCSCGTARRGRARPVPPGRWFRR